MIDPPATPLLDALEGRTETLLERLRQERDAHRALRARCTELERRLAEAEASRLELLEENRELDEQNRELEEHNRHLHARLTQGSGQQGGFLRPTRRSQGLSALIGRKDAGAAEEEAPSTSPAGARFIGRKDADNGPTQAQGHQSRLAIGEAPSPQALLGEWYQRYADTFFKGHTRPLKVGIHQDLAAREPWPEKLVRRALACYVNLPRYLKSVREGAERIDLTGQPAGRVDAQAAQHARRKLERLQVEQRGRPRQQRRQERGGQAAKRRATSKEPDATPPPAAASRPAAPRQADPAPTERTGPAEAPAPTSFEEKLSALVAKHSRR